MRSPGRSCTVCVHPKRSEIDRALLLKQRTPADIARQLGVNRSTVHRHFHQHLLPGAKDEIEKVRGDLVVRDEARKLFEQTRDLLTRLENEDRTNWYAWRGLLGEARQSLELLGRITGALDRPAGVNINQWVLMPANQVGGSVAELPRAIAAPVLDAEWEKA